VEVGWIDAQVIFTFTAVAYNIIRLRRLLPTMA
jgi:hypothetical protein